jgi:EAL domain-containing protein (putative c-di-GMP-specific phosphodiesterase class I)
VQKAHTAVSHGALRFLTKPVEPSRLIAAIEEACRTRIAVSAALGTTAPRRIRGRDPDIARLKSSAMLDEALATLWLAFQPVIAVHDGRIVGYEGLVRSDHAQLSRPDVLLKTAEDLGRLWDIGRRVRAAAARQLAMLPSTQSLLVNLHAKDLLDPELYDTTAPLSAGSERVILELTERAAFADLPDLADRLVALRSLKYRLAIDDLGAGYGSLSALALVRPELVKLDMSLIRGIDSDPVRREVVRGIGVMCKHLGTTWLCEGVETEAELRTVIDSGTELVQGYLLGRPSRVPTTSVGRAMFALLSRQGSKEG